MENKPGQPHYRISGRRWFDRINGNTYHTVRVYFPDGTVKGSGRTYGYGTQWEHTAFALIEPDREVRLVTAPWRYYEAHGWNVTMDCADVPRKKDLHPDVTPEGFCE
jgi:hypothetical protein